MRHPPPIQKPKPLIPKFFKHVRKTDSCWLWEGHRDRAGYGRIRLSPIPKKSLMFFVHRISWEIHNGKIPSGMGVLHTCDIRNCVNPGHLWIGTQFDNNLDKENKGRSRNARGEEHPGAILNDKLVRKIRKEFIPRKCTHEMLSRKYKVSESTIEKIIMRTLWKHI